MALAVVVVAVVDAAADELVDPPDLAVHASAAARAEASVRAERMRDMSVKGVGGAKSA